MPILRVDLFEGRSVELKQALARRFTEVVTEVLGTDPNDITIILSEVPPAEWYLGGSSYAQRPLNGKGE